MTAGFCPGTNRPRGAAMADQNRDIWIGRARWLRRRADDVCGILLVGMFMCFMIQITSRYVFNYPLGWT